MASPPITPLQSFSRRPFHFHPPILGVEHNEWLYLKATWSEVLVVNARSRTEIWVARRFIADVSRVDDPVLIVGLIRELEFRGGMVVPFQRRVIEMPVAAAGDPAAKSAEARGEPAPIIGIRVSSSADKRTFRLAGLAVTVAVVLCVLAVSGSQKRIVLVTGDQNYTRLTARDDRTGVLVKLGEPWSDRWRSDAGAMQYEALGYPDQNLTVILMGIDRRNMHYIGTMDKHWRAIHWVALPTGATTASLLDGIERF
jgi:hypothetical protein